MHFVNVEHTGNKLCRHPVRVCSTQGYTHVLFFPHPLRPFKIFGLPRGRRYRNVFISESSRVSREAPAPPSRRKYDLWKTRRQPQPSYRKTEQPVYRYTFERPWVLIMKYWLSLVFTFRRFLRRLVVAFSADFRFTTTAQ